MRARRPLPGPVLLAGVAGAVAPGIRPGDLVVADRVLAGGTEHLLPGAAQLAGALRRAGLTVHVGPVAGVNRIVTGGSRQAYAAAGALAVDMESGVLAARLSAVVRAIVDTPDHPLLRPGTVRRGIAALRALRRAAPILLAWDAAGDPGEVRVRAGRAAHPDNSTRLPGKVEESP